MKLLNVSLMLILLSCVFLLSRASAAEKNPGASALSKAEQKSKPYVQKDERIEKTPQSSKSISRENSQGKKDSEAKKPQQYWYDSPLFDFLWQTSIPNWLVIVGWVIAVIIAIGTLYALIQQVKANVDATKAATIQAKILIEQNRPGISVEAVADPQGWPQRYIESDKFRPITLSVPFAITNKGNGKASLKGKIILLELAQPPEPDVELTYPPQPEPFEWILFADEIYSRIASMQIDRYNDYVMVASGTLFIMLSGIVTYRDSFSDELYRTKFCSYWYRDTSHNCWVAGIGPSGWVDRT